MARYGRGQPHKPILLGLIRYAAASTLSITAPVANQGYTRNPTTAVISASGSGTNTGASTTIQYSLDGGSTWNSLSAGYTGGAWSGTISGVNPGTYTLTIRLQNQTGVTATVTPINVGDAFVTVGNSVLNGEATFGYNYLTGPGGIAASAFDVISQAWRNPTTRLRQDGNNAASLFQPTISLLLNDVGVPIIVIHCCQDSTDCLGSVGNSAAWAHAGTAYTNAVNTVTASGISRVTAVVAGGFGVVAAQPGNGTVVQATYSAAFKGMADGFAADLPGAPKTLVALPGSIQDATGAAADIRVSVDACRMALKALWDTGNVLRGPVWIDMGFKDDPGHIHPVDVVDCLTMGSRYWLAIMDEIYGTSHGRGPRLVTATLDSTKKIITLTFDQLLLAAVATAAQYLGGKIYTFGSTSAFSRASSCFVVKDSGTPASIIAVTRASTRRVVIEVDSPLSAVGNVTVDFASWNDAVSSLVYSDTNTSDQNADSTPYGDVYTLAIALPDGGSISANHIYQPAEPFVGQAVTAEGAGGTGAQMQARVFTGF